MKLGLAIYELLHEFLSSLAGLRMGYGHDSIFKRTGAMVDCSGLEGSKLTPLHLTCDGDPRPRSTAHFSLKPNGPIGTINRPLAIPNRRSQNEWIQFP